MKRRKFIQSSAITAAFISLATVSPAKEVPAKKGFVVRNGEDRANDPVKTFGVNPNLVKVSGKDTGGELSVFEYIGLTKTGPGLHVHLHQDEEFYVLEGEYLFQVGDERHMLKVGDSIFLPRNIPHTWMQLSEKGKLLYMLQPAGQMEEFFKKMSELKELPSKEELEKIHLAHGMKLVGPPITL